MNTFWVGNVKLNSARWLSMKLGASGLNDEKMLDLANFTDELLKPEAEGKPVWATVDLSDNAISSRGLAALLSVFERYEVQVKCLKLYKNQIGDDGGLCLVELIKKQREPLEELHLSHNLLTGHTMVSLCLAIHRNQWQSYPFRGKKQFFIPCWVRMEYNNIANPSMCMNLLRQEANMKICLAENRDLCGPWRCACQSKTKDKSAPSVHLFSIQVQSRMNRGGVSESEASLKELICSSRPRPAATPLKEASMQNCMARQLQLPTPLRSGRTGISVWGSPTKTISVCGIQKPAAGYPSIPKEPDMLQSNSGVSTAQTSTPSDTAEWSPVSCGHSEDSQVDVDFVDLNRIKVVIDLAQEPPILMRCCKCESSASAGKAWLLGPCSHVFCDECFCSFKAFANEEQTFTCPMSLCGQQVRERQVKLLDAKDLQKLGKRAKKAEAPCISSISNGICERPTAPENAAMAVSVTPSPSVNAVSNSDKPRHTIYPEQLLAGSGDSFLCHLCSYIAPRPVITSCSHMFCQGCFDDHVKQRTAVAQKSGQMTLCITCPNEGCKMELQKKDVTSLDADKGKQEGAAHVILRRLRSNMRVRCKHHPELYDEAFGQAAAQVQSVVKCENICDLSEILDHYDQCPVEKYLQTQCSPAINGALDPQHPIDKVNKEQDHGKNQVAIEENVQCSDRHQVSHKPNEQTYRCVYDFEPSENNQLSLRAGDLVIMYQTSDAGWAAGQKIDRQSMEPTGVAGWFPSGYCITVN